jgi:hypothetical protein
MQDDRCFGGLLLAHGKVMWYFAAHFGHQLLVVDFVEKMRQVHVHHPALAL